MTALPDHHDNVGNVHLKATEHEDNIIFLHAVETGPANQSYGLQVAQLAGVPANVIAQAKAQLQQLEQHAPGEISRTSADSPSNSVAIATATAIQQPSGVAEPSITAAQSPATREQPWQGDMFSAIPSVVEEQLGQLNPDDMTPRQALEALYQLKDLL